MAAGLGPHDPLSSPEVQSFVDGQAVAAMNNNHVAGLVVSVVQDGKLVMEKGYGTASRSNGSAMDPRRTMIRLGSVSQLFTWIALLKAVEAGRLSLDDPVNRRLPEALQIPDEGFDRPILLRHLMSQTAGFEDRALGRRFTRDPARILPLEEALKADRPRRVRAAGLVSIPSDYSAALAGEIVARTAGRPFDQLLEMEIFRPLGLDHTTFREPYPPREDLPEPLAPALADDLGEAFHWGRSGLEPEPTFYGQSLAPALSASSTADDMARLMIALLSGGAWEGRQIYGPATARLISVPLPEPIGPAPEWAHGLALLRLVGGETALVQKGSALGFHSSLFLAPGLNLGVFVGVNTDSGGPAADDLPSALVARFYGPGSGGSARPTAGGPSPEGPAPSNAPQAWGRYLSAQRAYHGLEAFADRLTLGSSLDGEPGGQDLTLTAAGASRVFHPVAENLYQAASGVELFLPPVSGGPQAYILGSGGGAAERVGGLHSVAALAVLCAAGAFAALASLAGLFMRDRADQRETRAQVLANAVQIVTCLTWCAAFATFGVFVAGGLDRDRLMFDWPNQWLVTTSWLALGGGVLTLAMAMQLPGVWREGRRIHGWSVWRKLRYSARLCTFLALTAVLAAWGVLEPWSS
jgi:CubicO group peptidase (beta-lactamase class C family)